MKVISESLTGLCVNESERTLPLRACSTIAWGLSIIPSNCQSNICEHSNVHSPNKTPQARSQWPTDAAAAAIACITSAGNGVALNIRTLSSWFLIFTCPSGRAPLLNKAQSHLNAQTLNGYLKFWCCSERKPLMLANMPITMTQVLRTPAVRKAQAKSAKHSLQCPND